MKTTEKIQVYICCDIKNKEWVQTGYSSAALNGINQNEGFISFLLSTVDELADTSGFSYSYDSSYQKADLFVIVITENISSSFFREKLYPYIKNKHAKKQVKVFPLFAEAISNPTKRKLSDLFTTFSVSPGADKDLSTIYNQKTDYTVTRNHIVEEFEELIRHQINERNDYAEIRSSKDPISLCISFLEKYPNSLHSEEVKTLLAEKQKEKKEADHAIKSKDLLLLRQFLGKYPQSPYKDNVQTAISEIEAKQDTQEKTDYQLLNPDNPALYYIFLKNYPHSVRYQEVSVTLHDLEEKAYQPIQNSTNIKKLKQYLETYPESAHCPSVRKKMTQLEKEPFRLKVRRAIANHKIPVLIGTSAIILIIGISIWWYYPMLRFILDRMDPLPNEITIDLQITDSGYRIGNEIYLNPNISDIHKDIPVDDSLLKEGITAYEAKDTIKAIEYFKRSATENQSGIAMYNLAVLNKNKNKEEAAHWMDKAVAVNYPPAVYHSAVFEEYLNNSQFHYSGKKLNDILPKMLKAGELGYAYDAYLTAGKIYELWGQEDMAIEQYKKAALEGNSEAGAFLTHLLMKKEDRENAFKYLKISLENDTEMDHVALSKLIRFYHNGYGCEANPQETFVWAQQAHEKGRFSSEKEYYNLGAMYYNGYGTDMNKSKAREILEKGIADNSIEKDNMAISLYTLGTIYYWGEEVETDYVKAASYFERILNITETTPEVNELKKKALYALGCTYYNLSNPARNIIYARDYFERAHSLGDKRASNMVGCIYALGKGKIKRNPSKAVSYFEAAIREIDGEKPNYNAKYNLGMVFAYGKRGYPSNPERASELLMSLQGEAALRVINDKRFRLK